MKNEKNRIDPEAERYEKNDEEQVEVDLVLDKDPGLVLVEEAKGWHLFLVDEHTPCSDEIAELEEGIHHQRMVL